MFNVYFKAHATLCETVSIWEYTYLRIHLHNMQLIYLFGSHAHRRAAVPHKKLKSLGNVLAGCAIINNGPFSIASWQTRRCPIGSLELYIYLGGFLWAIDSCELLWIRYSVLNDVNAFIVLSNAIWEHLDRIELIIWSITASFAIQYQQYQPCGPAIPKTHIVDVKGLCCDLGSVSNNQEREIDTQRAINHQCR